MSTVRSHRLLWVWLALTALCLVWMWLAPGEEVVPFHLIWIAFALAYGFEPWSLRLTGVLLAGVTVATSAILLPRAEGGLISWAETTELALMLVLGLMLVWHVQRRLAALAAVTAIADHQVLVARERERLARLTSHEMRTPLTIASGYVDLLLDREQGTTETVDLEVVRDELSRLHLASDRLLRMIRGEDLMPPEHLELGQLAEATVARWATVADRDWRAETEPTTLLASSDRVRSCLDTLIENAVRHTRPGDVIRVGCSTSALGARLLVADSGPGFTDAQARSLNDPRAPQTGIGPSGPHGQSGYGLGIVQAIVGTRGGLVRAGRAAEGGALVVVELPGIRTSVVRAGRSEAEPSPSERVGLARSSQHAGG